MRKLKSLPFFFAMAGCRRHCVYCDQTKITGTVAPPSPQEVAERLSELEEPVEIAFFGGSFTCLPTELVKAYLSASGTAPAGSTLRISTHPCCISAEIVDLLSEYAARKCPLACVELGISSLDDDVLRTCARGYSGEQALNALDRLMEAGLPAGAQLMIGLPGQDESTASEDLRRLARAKGPRSMDLRLYPCLVLSGTPLADLWSAGLYTPLDTVRAASWAGRLMVEALDLGFNILRVGLAETPSLASAVCSGPHHPAFGELAWGDCLARLLTRNASPGPWVEHRRRLSAFTGHGKWGLTRLMELSGKSEVSQADLTFWPSEINSGKERAP